MRATNGLRRMGDRSFVAAAVAWFSLLLPAWTAAAADPDEAWPHFRGTNGEAKAKSDVTLPDVIGPKQNVVWSVELPPGHSSPVIAGNRIFVTAVSDDKLLTIALDRKTGRKLWERDAPYESLEKIHSIGSLAQPTPATDGERVVSFFGSCGLFCYDLDGKPLWKMPMGPFNNDFGAAASPLIVGERVILCQDHDTGSFLISLDKRTGEVVWRTDRSEFPRSCCTPVIAEVNGRREIVVAATLRVVGYDFDTGQELWTVRGIARAACSSPTIGEDGTIYLATYAAGGDPDSRITVEPFEQIIPKRDANQNGTLEEGEFEAGDQILRRYSQVDRDKSGSITRDEYEFFRNLFDQSRNVVIAIRPGGRGDVTGTHVAWEFTRFVPFIASPVLAAGHIFTVKDGGIVTSIDAKTGGQVKTKRIDATDAYYSSPVGGDGKLYLINEEGKATVLRAAGEWEVVSTSEFGEGAYATPAIHGGQLLVRTVGHLYCFGVK